MNKYTPEELEAVALRLAGGSASTQDEVIAADATRAYATTLRQAPAQGGVTEAMEALRPFANAYRRLRHYGDSPTDETPLYAYAGEGHPLYELLNGEHGERLTVQTLGEAAAALEAALSAEPAAQVEAVIDAKYDNVLVPFARLMAQELHANAGKGDRHGWLSMTPAIGMLEIYYHAAKLQKAVKDDNGEGIREYAADVANMAMMLLDLCGGLAVTDAAPPAQPAERLGVAGALADMRDAVGGCRDQLQERIKQLEAQPAERVPEDVSVTGGIGVARFQSQFDAIARGATVIKRTWEVSELEALAAGIVSETGVLREQYCQRAAEALVDFSHLPQPAQAVDMEHEMVLAFRAGAKWADEHVAPDGRLIGKLLEPRALTVARASNEYAGERTASPAPSPPRGDGGEG